MVHARPGSRAYELQRRVAERQRRAASATPYRPSWRAALLLALALALLTLPVTLYVVARVAGWR